MSKDKMKLDEKLMEIVKSSLPGMQADAIEAFAKEANEMKAAKEQLDLDCCNLEAMLEERYEEVKRLRTRLANIEERERDQDRRRDQLNAREKDIESREQKASINEVLAVAEKEKRALVVSMFETVFRNVEVKRSVTRSVSTGEIRSGGYNDNGEWKNDMKTGESTEENVNSIERKEG